MIRLNRVLKMLKDYQRIRIYYVNNFYPEPKRVIIFEDDISYLPYECVRDVLDRPVKELLTYYDRQLERSVLSIQIFNPEGVEP